MSLANEIMQTSKENPEWGVTALAKHFGCRREYVRTAARRLKFKIKVFKSGTWNDADDAILRNLRESKKLKWAEIAEEMDRPRSSCSNRYEDLISPPIRSNLTADRVVVPAELYKERDERINLAPRDLIAAFMGDPKPGFSALDRRP